jgi:short-chain Z-isoprenyl diphosphate synthase
VSGIFTAIETKLRALAEDNLVHRRRIRVRAIGRISMLPEPVVAAITAAERATAAYDGMELNFAMAYGGRQEIVDAMKAMLHCEAQRGATLPEAIARISPAAITEHLYTAGLPDPDLIIRTSGEIRLSGFLLWQSAHSEFYFTDILWPAFRKIDFLRAIRAFQARRRRYGR